MNIFKTLSDKFRGFWSQQHRNIVAGIIDEIKENEMSFNLANFEAKMAAVLGVLPTVGQLIQTAQVLAPNAAGLTKAGMVINTVVAAEPLLIGMEQTLAAAITGIVNVYRSAGTLPAPVPSTPTTPQTP